MSEHPPPTADGGTLVRISERLIRVLPPAFIVLVILNIGTLFMVAYLYSHNSEARNEMLRAIIDGCLRKSP
jgi:hypothetical protein